MSVLTNPRFLAAKTTLTTEVGQYLKDFGMDTERAEWVILIGQLRKKLGHPVRGIVLDELLNLLADRVKCEWDDVPLMFPVKHPEYAFVKNAWLEAQDQTITAKCLEVMGSAFINNFGSVAA